MQTHTTTTQGNTLSSAEESTPFRGLLTRLLHEAFYLEEEVPLLENDDSGDDADFIRQFLGQLAS